MRAQYPMPGRGTPWRPFWGPVRGHRCWRGHPSRDYGPRMVKRAVPKPNLQPRCRFRPLELPKVEPWWRSEPVSNGTNVMNRGSTCAARVCIALQHLILVRIVCLFGDFALVWVPGILANPYCPGVVPQRYWPANTSLDWNLRALQTAGLLLGYQYMLH